MQTLIEDKVKELLTAALIDDVDDYIVQGIDDWLLDWDSFDSYPRLVIACEEFDLVSQMIGGACTKEYIVNIFTLCYNKDKTECVAARDEVVARIEAKLRKNQSLDNLADNTNTESVYGSTLGRTRLSKSGMMDSYQAVAWTELRVQTDRKIP
jgi:hypothetical protein